MDLQVAVSGDGPDLVLLHGWGMDTAVWDELAAHLALGFRIHNVALPGYGGSVPCMPYTLNGMVEMLVASLPPRVHVCGWSLGGQLALAWAMRYPAQIERLVLISTTPRFVKDDEWECAIPAAVLDDFEQSLERDCEGTLQRFVLLQARNDAELRAVSRSLRARTCGHGVSDTALLCAGLRLLRDTDLRGTLRRIAQPALIVHGDRDALVPVAAGAYLQRDLQNAILEIVAGAAHAPFVSQPLLVARSISEFCSGR